MARGNNHNVAPPQAAAGEDTPALIGVMRGMIELQHQQVAAQQRQMDTQEARALEQQKQTEILRDGLLAAQQTAAAAIERAAVPRGPRVGSVTDFMRLNPRVFTGNEAPLEAEQWLVDVTNLLAAANIPAAEQVKVVKIQLADIARTWWQTEESKLAGEATWKDFTEGFDERFFPEMARKEMEEKFISLKQWNQSVDDYAAEFSRLSRFAAYMVADEAKRASRFQQGLKMDLQKSLFPQ